ncbi:tubulin-specific chaperone E-like [Lytechinus pictus]|uniref:tubulin-specific chaperone E-like n=1 Tax=Lytechinus pictus TaxID=7653 RepID=UPI0030B9C76C
MSLYRINMSKEFDDKVLSDMKVEEGDRILSEGQYGTVKFVGLVPSTEGIWLGVEWDNPERGKHDGSHKGTRYFQCSSPTSGSFLRPKKADFGIQFLDAVSSRYIPENIETADFEDSLAVSCKAVEMVGAEKIARRQSSFENLKSVALHEMRISRAGDEKVAERLPNMKELDVSKNLLPSWEELSKITASMQKLKILNVSENRFVLPTSPSTLCTAFYALEELSLNRCNITWKELLMSSTMWPKLKKLHACYNRIANLDKPLEGTFDHLELLNVEGNQIETWEGVLQLGHLPRLEGLILNNNSIPNISFEDASMDGKTKYFRSLKSLSLHNNRISEWNSVNELRKLQCLDEVNMKRNPLVQNEKASTVRGLLIAKLPSLCHCNHSAVSEAERKGSEIDYMKKYHEDWLKNGGGKDQPGSNLQADFIRNHPMYTAIIKKYGAPEVSDDSQSKPGALKSSLLELILSCPQHTTKKSIKKKLPVTMDITKVKGMIQKLFKVDVADQKLSYLSPKLPDQEIPLDNDLRQLGFFGVESGNTIMIRW